MKPSKKWILFRGNGLPSTAAIYKIVSPTGKIYIGQTRNIKKRFQLYKRLHCKSQTKLYASFIKHGFDKHFFYFIGVEKYCLNRIERWLVSRYNSFNRGLNGTPGGDIFPGSVQEIRDKISKSLIGRPRPDISLMHKGRILGEEWKSKIGEGVSSSEKYKKGIKNRDFFGAKNPFHGKHHSREQKDKWKGRNKILYSGGGNPAAIRVININTKVIYGCVKDAAMELGIHPETLRRKLRGNVKNDSPFIIYNDSK